MDFYDQLHVANDPGSQSLDEAPIPAGQGKEYALHHRRRLMNRCFDVPSVRELDTTQRRVAAEIFDRSTCARCLAKLGVSRWTFEDVDVLDRDPFSDQPCFLCSALRIVAQQCCVSSTAVARTTHIDIKSYSETDSCWTLVVTVIQQPSRSRQEIYSRVNLELSRTQPARSDEINPPLEWQEIPCSTRLQKVSSWLQNCMQHHKGCIVKDVSVLPPRVLDLGVSADEHEGVVLVDSNQNAVAGAYATLSHKWGTRSQQDARLSRETEPRFRGHIQWDLLPNNFQDAVIVCRNLGIRYLWIDSLCIIQDDEEDEDWAWHAKNMGSIYQGSLITIEASRSDGSSSGFLQSLNLKVSSGERQANFGPQTPVEIGLSSLPLNKRGWTLQEHMLSARKLSFLVNRYKWQCSVETRFETMHTSGNEVILKPHQEPVTLDFFKTGFDDNFHAQWTHMVKKDYMPREFTYEKDRLAALGGIMAYVASQRKEACFAGHWASDLPKSLAWWVASEHKLASMVERPSNTRDQVAPSWSWAHLRVAQNEPDLAAPSPPLILVCSGPADPDDWTGAKVISVDCSDIGLQDPRQQTGELVLETLVFSGQSRVSEDQTIVYGMSRPWSVFAGETDLNVEVHWDLHWFVLNDAKERPVVCAALPPLAVQYQKMQCFLILEAVDDASNVFRRIGLAVYNKSEQLFPGIWFYLQSKVKSIAARQIVRIV